jgi:aryl-alcohol dehydrogenase-like predicted oxidoreductase
MRYRPFGSEGPVVSAVSLRLRADRAPDSVAPLIHGAVEHGINYFELPAGAPDLLDAVGAALAPVDRDLLIVALNLGGAAPGAPQRGSRDFSPQTLANQIVDATRRTGVGRLDVVILDDPAEEELPGKALETLKLARSTNRVRRLGVSGVDDAIDAYLSAGAFDLLVCPFSLASGWGERRRVITAERADMTIIGCDFWPAMFRRGPKPERPGLLARALAPKPKAEPLAGAGSYAFLDHTPGWTSEQICLAYALSDLRFASVMVDPTSLEHLASLAEVADREISSALAAQVEMARFSAESA